MRWIYFLWILLPALVLNTIRFGLRFLFWGGIQRMLTLAALALLVMVLTYVQD